VWFLFVRLRALAYCRRFFNQPYPVLPCQPRGARCFSIASCSCHSLWRHGACSNADSKGRRSQHPWNVSVAALAFAAACDDAVRTDFDFPPPCCPFTSELEPSPILLFALLCPKANSKLLDCSSKLVLTSMHLKRECCSVVFVRDGVTARASLLPTLLPPTSPRPPPTATRPEVFPNRLLLLLLTVATWSLSRC